MARTRHLVLAGALLSFCIIATRAQSEIFRWTDASGGDHFVMNINEVPPEYRDAALNGAASRPKLQVTGGRAPKKAARGKKEFRRGQFTPPPGWKNKRALRMKQQHYDRQQKTATERLRRANEQLEDVQDDSDETGWRVVRSGNWAMDPERGTVLDKSNAESLAEDRVREERQRLAEIERKRRQADIDAKRKSR